MSKALKMVITYDQKYNIGLCFGLAPRPWGFTFESTGNKRRNNSISYWLNKVEDDSESVDKLRQYIRGEKW